VTDPAPPAGVSPWVRCFAEELRPAAGHAVHRGDDRPWRVRAATRSPLGAQIRELFPDDPAADQALAIVGDPANPDACAVALAAARDAIGSGRLVLITHGPGFTGFCASLHAEHPELGITVLRVPESAAGLRAARRFAAAEPGTFRELVIDTAGQPHETIMMPTQTASSGDFPLGPGDVVLVSRGAGGAGLALAQVLACCGAPIAVIGREVPGEAAEVDAGLGQLKAAGVRLSIEAVDIANPADLSRALERIERRLGPITAVAHAVGVAGPRPIADLAEDELRAHVGAEAASLHQLVSAITAKQLRLIITFGSVAGRYGLAGEGLLALASGSLADRAERMADAIPGCRALHVDWPAWSGPGLGQRASLADRLAQSGASAIGVEEGSRLLLKTLATPGLPPRLAVHGRVGVPGPPPIAVSGPRPRDARLPGRFLEEILVHYPGVELVCDARLSLRTDPYLSDYAMDGMIVLPAVMALEAMAEAASALAGRPMRRLTGVSMEAPVVVPASTDNAAALIRICALKDGPSVTAVIRCAESGFAAVHFRATFDGSDNTEGPDVAAAASLAASLPELDELPASHAGIVDGTELYGPICFPNGPFRRAALLPEVTSRSCRALVGGGDGQPWFAEEADPDGAPLVLGSPGLNDATWHVLQACVPHRRLLPGGCESVTFSGRTADGAVEIRAAAVEPGPGDAAAGIAAGAVPGQRSGAVPEQRSAAPPVAALAVPAQGPAPDAARPSPPAAYVWDVEAVDSAGRPLVTWRGLRLVDAGPLPRATAWPPSLLSVYLEHSAVALGLDPELRVTVHSGLADGAASPPALVPRPSPAPDGPRAAGSGEPRPQSAPGTGHLEGFVLTVRAPDGAACGWEAAVPGAAGGPDPAPGVAEIEAQLRQALGEPPIIVAAMLRAITACLAMTDAPGASPAVAGDAAEDGWLALRAGTATLACTVAEISGVSSPVAIALMTGDASREAGLGDQQADERGDDQRARPGKRQRRQGGAKAGPGKAAGSRGASPAAATQTAQRGRPGSGPE
jgi:enediyne polyketide synthase